MFQLLSWCDASPIKPLPSSEVLPIGKIQIGKSPTDSVKDLPIESGMQFIQVLFVFSTCLVQ